MKASTRCFTLVAILALAMGSVLTDAMAADLTWYTSKQSAVDKAVLEGKKILLLAGRAA